MQQNARSLGIATITLRRAKRRLGVMAKKRGLGPWEWEKPVGSGAATKKQPSALGLRLLASSRQQAISCKQPV